MKADLNLHSRFSDRSADWLFRRFDFPDSYSQPRALYDLLRERGMDLVTLTDHNTLDGVLEIAALPGVFLSEEVTTYFPEDRCKVHLLVWNISEAQHREIASLRENIFDLQRYLGQEKLAHAVAHPLYQLNHKLTVSHLERLILLFPCFEGLNGLRNDLLNQTTRHLLASLTPETIARFAETHGFAPTHPEAWKKVLTAGSDDKSGMYAAHAYTETPGAANVDEFLTGLCAGRAAIHGDGGSPLVLSHSLYKTGLTSSRKASSPGKSSSWPSPRTRRCGANWRGISHNRRSRRPSPGKRPTSPNPSAGRFSSPTYSPTSWRSGFSPSSWPSFPAAT